MLAKRSRVPLAITVIVIVCALVALMQPAMANHFGYALPGPRGLPYRLTYAGRTYANPSTCAGAGWCDGAAPIHCATTAWLRRYGYWPLARVGTLWVMIGLPYPMLRSPTPAGMTTMGLYVPIGRDCYLNYSLEGGP
jgi:hypothetical protein